MEKLKSRRTFLKTGVQAAAGVGVLAGPLTAIAGQPREGLEGFRSAFRQPAADAPRAQDGLIEGVGVGRPFSGLWQIRNVYGPVAGGLTLVLQDGIDGRPLRVDLCLIGDAPRAPVSSAFLELYVMDGGGGNGCIDEGLMEALQTLGRVIRKNEEDPRLLEGILTFEERWELYPDFMACAATELEPGVEPQKR